MKERYFLHVMKEDLREIQEKPQSNNRNEAESEKRRSRWQQRTLGEERRHGGAESREAGQERTGADTSAAGRVGPAPRGAGAAWRRLSEQPFLWKGAKVAPQVAGSDSWRGENKNRGEQERQSVLKTQRSGKTAASNTGREKTNFPSLVRGEVNETKWLQEIQRQTKGGAAAGASGNAAGKTPTAHRKEELMLH